MSHEWQAFISRTHKLRKVFVSVKGIYYQVRYCFFNYVIFHSVLCIGVLRLCCLYVQAEVKGQLVTWLTPHPLQQVLTEDIDFNIMLNFLEFYEVYHYVLVFLQHRLSYLLKSKLLFTYHIIA